MKLLPSILAIAAVCATTAVVAATNPTGSWKAATGKGSFEMAACGASYCASPGTGGRVVFRRGADQSDRWQGEATDAQGHTFRDLTMRVANDSELVLKGCLAVFCVEQTYTRID